MLDEHLVLCGPFAARYSLALRGSKLTDSGSFHSGTLFTTDYLADAVKRAPEYQSVPVDKLRSKLVHIAGKFPKNAKTNESQTEDDFIWPVLAELGWTDTLRQQNLSSTGRQDVPDGVLFLTDADKVAANSHPEQWRRYAYGAAVVESKRWARPLDRASGRDETTAPSTQMLRYLRRIDDLTNGSLRWGILTNGTKWRLYWAGARSLSEEFLEIDLAEIVLGGEAIAGDAKDHWLRVFAIFFSPAAFTQTGADKLTFHERARNEAKFYEERVAANLAKLVFDEVFPNLASAIAEVSPKSELTEVRDASLVLLYRLLFVLYAEDRDLLPANDRRYDDYALRPLRVEIGKRVSDGDKFSKSASKVWAHIADLSRIIDKGDSSVGIPPYNGGLFSSASTPLLDSVRIPDSTLATALDALSYDRSAGERRYINYRDLSVQQLGSIYERLLEFDLKRDKSGALQVRPNPFARKNSGSYYTPDELVGLIIDQTLEPLISERLGAFGAFLTGIEGEDPDDTQLRELRDLDPAEAILKLRVCDPAMGSGHFLVSVVDTLADHVLAAMAEAALDGGEFHYRSPLADKIEDIRSTILKNAKRSNWTIDEAQLDDRHIVRRMVLKRCVYGVDKNPMAVELAKVALWLNTFTVGAPLSFIDHHLRAGDSLFGMWVRPAVDKASAFGGELLYSDALRNAQRSAEAMKTIEALTDAEVAEAHRSASMYQDVELMTGELDGFVSFIHALDWLDLKSKEDKVLIRNWLDGRFGDPIPIARGKKIPEAGKTKPEEYERFVSVWERARALISDERFLNWQIAFPGVWSNWIGKDRDGGFDAVVGNPPWDRFEFEEVPWFEFRDRSIALEPSGAKRKARINALRKADDSLWSDYVKASERLAMATGVVKSDKIYTTLNVGKLNLFKLFVERSHQLVKPDGIVGLLVPSGIAGDQSSSGFFKELSVGRHLKALFDFENRRGRYGQQPFFPDVDTRFKFCVLVASPARTFAATACAFFLQDVSEIRDEEKAFALTAEDFTKVNPNTGTAPIFRSRREMVLTTELYKHLPVLVNRSKKTPVTTIPVKYWQVINLTSDSELFRTRAELEEKEKAWPIEGNRYQSKAGVWQPLYEGKMVQAFDHRAASVVVNPENTNRPAQPLATTLDQHMEPDWLPAPQFWILPKPGIESAPYALAYKDVTSPTNVRSMIAAIIPSGTAGNSLPVIEMNAPSGKPDAGGMSLLAANLNSIAYDFLARQKIQGQHLNWFIVEQLPVIPPDLYEQKIGGKTIRDLITAAVLELSYTSNDLAAYAKDMGFVEKSGKARPPFKWNEERRQSLRAKLDAIYFLLYKVVTKNSVEQGRSDIRYIFSTFPILEREDTAQSGEYKSCELALAWVNALLSGKPDADISHARTTVTGRS